ncbi:MAG: GAF domain-containing protein [Rhodospirillaceae bacterium]|nr:GAF domain-containing protein [Rhodospirillaceae bacterium]
MSSTRVEDDTPREVFGLRVTALVEMAIFFTIALLLDRYAFDGDRFREVAPHPFWAVVVLISLQYGTNEGLLAAVASSAALLVGNVPPQPLALDLFAYLFDLSKTPLMWAATGLVVGELRSRQLRERADLRKRLAESETQAQVITAAFEGISAAKDELEARIAGQFRTLLTVFRAAMAVERLDVAGVFEGANALVAAILNPEKFSIWLLKDAQIEMTRAFGWKDDERYKRVFLDDHPLYRRTVVERIVLCVARVADEKVLAGEGVLAGPLQDPETDEVYGMLKIEVLGLLDLTPTTIENFQLLCDWIGSNLAIAKRYEDAQSERILDPEAGLLSAQLFDRQKEFLVKLAERVDFDLTMLIVGFEGEGELSRDEALSVGKIVAVAVGQWLRETDLAFQWLPVGRRFAVLLPATNGAGARLVMRKLKDDISIRLNVMADRVRLTFEIEELHRREAKR